MNCDARQGQLVLATGAKQKGQASHWHESKRKKLPSIHAHAQTRSSCSCTIRIPYVNARYMIYLNIVQAMQELVLTQPVAGD